jgi:hypothetical protein
VATEPGVSANDGATFERTPEITRDGMQTILEEIAESRPLPAGIAPQRFFDARVFRELSESDCLDRFYRGR